MAKTIEPDVNESPIPFAPWLANGQKTLFAAARLQGQAYRTILRYQIEMLSFLKHRVEQDLKLVDDLIATEDFNGAFDVCTGFCEIAISEYSSEAGKIASISSKFAADTAKRIRKEAEVITEDMAARSVA